MNFQSTTFVHETLGQQRIVKKHSPMETIIFTRFFRVPSQLGKTHHLLEMKTSKKPSHSAGVLSFPWLLVVGEPEFWTKSRSVSCFFPWKVCGQETSGGSIFSVKERYLFSKRVLKNWRKWPKLVSEKTTFQLEGEINNYLLVSFAVSNNCWFFKWCMFFHVCKATILRDTVGGHKRGWYLEVIMMLLKKSRKAMIESSCFSFVV